MKHLYYGLLLSIALVACGKGGPTDEQLTDLCRNAGFAVRGAEGGNADETFLKMAKEAEAQFDIQKITPEQVELLFTNGGQTFESGLRNWLTPVFEKKTEESTIFAYYYWKYYPDENILTETDTEIEAFKTLIRKADIDTFIKEKEGAAAEILDGAVVIGGDQWTQHEMLGDVKHLLTLELPEDAMKPAVSLFNAAFTSNLPAAEKEEIRKAVLSLYQNYEQQASTPSKKKRAAAQIAYLESPFAKGTLIGNKAPELHFRWISGGNEKTLDDFKGKVVMLDFWATKCTPCIESFPQIAELQNHYKNSPVAIIGVTSIQGYFIDIPNKKTVSTTNDPEKEISLVPAYMKGMGINWRIAFTEEDVMNVDYGVLAIPHVTIIDKEGRVRYNGLNETNEEKIKLIDSLLNE